MLAGEVKPFIVLVEFVLIFYIKKKKKKRNWGEKEANFHCGYYPCHVMVKNEATMLIIGSSSEVVTVNFKL